MIFVDTSVWYSVDIADDPEHHASRQVLLSATDDFVIGDPLPWHGLQSPSAAIDHDLLPR